MHERVRKRVDRAGSGAPDGKRETLKEGRSFARPAAGLVIAFERVVLGES